MKVNQFLPSVFTLLLFTTVFNGRAQTVTTTSELLNEIDNATTGTTITLADGTYEDVSFDLNMVATASKPFIIKALNPGKVFFEGNVNMKLGGSYITIAGIIFQNPSGLVTKSGKIAPIIEWRDGDDNECNHCTITNIKIDSFNGTNDQKTDTFKWIFAYGQDNEISFSSFVGKNGIGSVINDNRNTSEPDRLKIHHNYFADRTEVRVDDSKRLANDLDAIRIGNSTTSKEDSDSEVYENLFENWIGEVEIISNKSGNNKYYNNTFRKSRGALTLRHGLDCEVYGNYFFGGNIEYSGGIRVMDAGHKVYNNYMEGLNSKKPGDSDPSDNVGAINLTNGVPNSDDNEYFEVKDALIVNNTIVNCDFGIRVGSTVKSELTVPPNNVTIANNIIVNSSESAILEQTTPKNSTYEGNLNQDGSWDITNGTNDNETVSSDLLTDGADFYRLANGSPAIDAAIGSYSFLTKDIIDGVRSGNVDAGAEEFGANGTRFPYTSDDVGDSIGFGASLENYLNVSTSTLNFTEEASKTTFAISSDLSWTISDDASWLNFSTTTGTSEETITVTVTENTSDTDRTAVINITDSSGMLTATITVVQRTGMFNPNNPLSLNIIDVTAVGTQDGKGNVAENSIDGEIGTEDGEYWAALSDNGSAYITFDLGCAMLVTNVDIAFLKGNSRASSFKIATSFDGASFTEVTELITSSGTTSDFETFSISPNPKARYVRILGYGNSDSDWNSYTEVNIYGDDTCTTLSVMENSFTSKGLVLFPIPAKDKLHVVSKNNTAAIGFTKIFDLNGRLLSKHQINSATAAIDISALRSGVYMIQIQNSFETFVIATK